MTEPDRLVEEYLGEVARACAGLPTLHRIDLMADLREHIAVTRAGLPAQTEPAVRAILHRLGDPATIAAEAHASAPPPRTLPPPALPAIPKSLAVVALLIPVLVIFAGLFVLWLP